MKTGQTPLEALQSRKRQLRLDARIQEERIGENIKYMQHNGGKLVLHSLASALIPGKSAASHSASTAPSSPSLGLADLAMGGLSSVLKGNKGILPLLWGAAQPYLLSWGIKGIKRLFRKKRK